MDNVLETALETFIGFIENGMFIAPPDNTTLNHFTPNIAQLQNQRDQYGIIEQVQADGVTLDGGDSAHKTGVLAFCNSIPDILVLNNFEQDGIMVRHPNFVPANNWKNCSRDQLIAYISGCWRAGKFDIANRLYEKHQQRIPPFTCQNTENDHPGTAKNPPIGDLLMPHDIMFFKICTGDNDAYKDLMGQLSLQIAIEVTPNDISHEYTQLLLQAIVCGRLNHFVTIHPEYKSNLRYYWGGWRNQIQIAEALIEVIDIEMKRYDNLIPIPLPFRFPANLINEILKLKLPDDLINFDPANRIELAQRFINAFLLDIQIELMKQFELNKAIVQFALNALNDVMTWAQIGLGLAEQIVEQGIEFAVNVLFGGLINKNQNLEELYQKFADQIVERLTANMRDIVNKAFYQNNMTLLVNNAQSMENEYRAYQKVKSTHLLDDLEEKTFAIIQSAKSMEIPAIGIYCTQVCIQIAIFRIRAQTNKRYHDLIAETMIVAENHIKGLRDKAIQKINDSFELESRTQYVKGEIDVSWVSIYYDKVYVNSVITYSERFPDNEKDLYAILNKYKAEKIAQWEAPIYTPAIKIIENLKLSLA
ncbi:hypothetical protein [Flavobacterium wongokense]|uniref:hypothetical protein n=1 Tax=Flavobacterium wongokense TaxID=2910674 RepID=UPI001F2F394E|nr:hypothetical protein [Flavobacterium sp. WG47]MCF6132219.1 hypothetical protein [Flavobacterium sp. WG47]